MDKDICTICLEPINNNYTTVLKCNHIFHTKCIDLWSVNSLSCPICRKKYEKPYAYCNPPHFIIPHKEEVILKPSLIDVMLYVWLIISIVSILDYSKVNKNWGYTKFNFTVTIILFTIRYLLSKF